jgi:ribosomal peptide maturation radical SAM protein 1
MSESFKSDFSLVLVSMPWATTTRPSLSLGLLSAVTKSLGYTCDVLYTNISLSALMGCNGYEYFSNTPSLFGIAEHLFAVDVFGPQTLDSDAYLAETARRCGEIHLRLGDALPKLRDQLIPDLLDAYAEEVLRRKPNLVGFTCTFNQVMASVALARRIKSVAPQTHVVLGGPCVHGEMGICYSRIFASYVDTVFLGEADNSFSDYLASLSEGKDAGDLRGIARRGRHAPETKLFDDLDALPVPDYSQYFDFRDQLGREGFRVALFHSLPFEASRGCWWGEKHHCTFCGLNNEGMRYRRKSVARIKGELTTLAERHCVKNFMAADNILDHRGYKELLPELAAIPTDLKLFFEIKTNITRADVESLAKAGVTWVQPGIESFSDHVLALMRKGATALQNIQTLKWLYEFGIEISYNLLVGFPGETESDYTEVLDLINKLHHLPPPGPEAHIVQVQRFAPFHFAAADFGIGPIRGARYYDNLIPGELAQKEEYAYFFDRDIPLDAPLHRYLGRVDAALQQWCSAKRRLSLLIEPGCLRLKTVEGGVESFRTLDKVSSIILVSSDQVTGEAVVLERILSGGIATKEDVLTTFCLLENDGLIVRHQARVVSVVPFQNAQTVASLDQWLQKCGSGSNGRSDSSIQSAVSEPFVKLARSQSSD